MNENKAKKVQFLFSIMRWIVLILFLALACSIAWC